MTLFLIQAGICKKILCLSIFKGEFPCCMPSTSIRKRIPFEIINLSLIAFWNGCWVFFTNTTADSLRPWVLCASSGSAMPLSFERPTVPPLKALWPLREGYKKGVHARNSDIFEITALPSAAMPRDYFPPSRVRYGCFVSKLELSTNICL